MNPAKYYSQSIRRKLNIVIISIIMIMFFIIIFPISIFYEPYYISGQEDLLKSVYATLANSNSFEELNQTVYDIEVNEHINVLILNHDFNIAYSTLTRNNGYLYKEIYTVQSMDSIFYKLENQIESPIIARTINNYSGIDNLHLFAFFQLDESIYYIILEMPLGNVSQIMRGLIAFMIMCLIPMSIVTSIIVSNVSNFFISPIVKLSEISEKLAQFEFGADIDITTNDEIGILARNMKILSVELESKWKELEDKNALLEESLKEKDKNARIQREFISNVSHELKTPITLILGYIEAINMDDVDTETKKEYMEYVVAESHKMNNLISDMLDISRLQSGDKKLQTMEFDFSDLVDKVVTKHKINFEKNEITPITNIEKDCVILGDKSKLELVVSNFLVNAIRYVDNNKIIKIDLRTTDNGYRFSIFNTANHFSDDDIKKIWGSFYKVDKAHSREKGGTGIGLYLVKVILELHGFSYGVKNKDNGVEFYIEM